MTAPLSDAESRIEAAYELLGAVPERHGHRECPGCDRLIHHTRTYAHAAEPDACPELHALVRAEGTA